MTVARVATFNVRHCRGLDGRVDLDRTAHVIRGLEADLVALQELDVAQPRSGLVDQPAALADAVEMRVSFWPTVTLGDGAYGIAVATRDPLDPRLVPLPRLGKEEPRGAVVARWRGLSVVATHLSNTPGPRAAQTEALGALASSLRGPVVVLGDLNQPLKDLSALTTRGFRGAARPVPSLATPWRRRQLDHVLVGPGLRLEKVERHPSDASDHVPITGVIGGLAPGPA